MPQLPQLPDGPVLVAYAGAYGWPQPWDTAGTDKGPKARALRLFLNLERRKTWKEGRCETNLVDFMSLFSTRFFKVIY